MFKLPVMRSFPLGSDQRERSATCCRAKLGAVQIPRGARAAVSTLVEPVEPNGLAGFSLCPEVCGVDDMPVSDRYSFPKRQTEIPTDLFSEVVGIVILCAFVVDLDFIVEQDDLIYNQHGDLVLSDVTEAIVKCRPAE